LSTLLKVNPERKRRKPLESKPKGRILHLSGEIFGLDEALTLIDDHTPAIAALICRCAAQHPFGHAAETFRAYKYTRFCEYYRRFKCKQEVSLRQEYKAWERMFVDRVGDTIAVWDAQTGESTGGST